jgi:SAM-dependent methyltransferase
MLIVAVDFMSTLSRILARMSNTVTSQATDSLIAVLDAVDAAPGLADLRAYSYQLLGVTSGTPVVDVGCGAGRAVAEIAESNARPVGVDVSEQMIGVARRRWPALDFRLGDAYTLPLGDGEVAGYRADKLYHEIGDPARALAEARRVLAPGGRIVLLGQDWDTFVIDSGDPRLTRVIVHARADTVPSPRAARKYRNLLLDAGFQDVAAEARMAVFTDPVMLPVVSGLAEGACAAGAVSREQTDGWIAEQAERAAGGRLFLAVPVFIAAARRA